MPGVEGVVASTAKSNSKPNYPLWIIAFSLLVIAACLVVDSIERKRARSNDGPLAAAAAEPEPVHAPDLPEVKTPTKPRREPPRATEENPASASPAPEEVAAPTVTVLPAAHSTVGGPQPVGYSVSGNLAGSNLGEIAGRITLNGTPPPETVLTTESICSRPIMTRAFVVGESNGLADAVIYIKRRIEAAASPPSKTPLTVSFTNCEVQPYVATIMARQSVNFRDEEGVGHELSLGDSSVTRTFVVPKKSGHEIYFPRPRLFVRVLCLEHSWEKSFLCIFENPFFAVTDKNGNFDIPNVPPGTYTIEVAHPAATGTNGVTRSVIVVAGKKAELNVALKVPNNGN